MDLKKLLTGLAAVVALATGTQATAASMAYSFYTTGIPDVSATSGFPPGLTNLHGFFTVSDLPANAVNYTATISDWLFADGVTTVTPASDYSIGRSEFTTNELGELTNIFISISRNGAISSFPSPTNTVMTLRQSLVYDWASDNTVDYCWSSDGGPFCDTGHYLPAGNGYLSPVPAPGTLVLVMTGVTALGLRQLHRRRGS